jgi:2-polyprenyl-3-methyl-5-hydroxy-6-metoxy-1,4-benzoquinol methylase
MVAFQRNNYDVYGLEPSEPFYKKAIEKTGISSEKLILTTIEDYEFEPEQFDVIILAAVLEHLYYPNDVIKKLMVGLKPGGLIFIEVPHSKWLISRILNAFYKIKGLDYVTNLSPMHSPFHLFEFSLQSFEQNAKINNYEILDYTYYVCDTFMPKILNPLLIPFMKYTKTGMELAIWLRKPSG